MSHKKAEELTAEQQQLIVRVKRLMAIPLLVMVVGFLTVFGVIGYRLYFRTPPATTPAFEKSLYIPKGAQVISTVVSDGKITVTVEVAGTTEVLVFDLDSLQPRGRFIIKTP